MSDAQWWWRLAIGFLTGFGWASGTWIFGKIASLLSR